MKITEVEALHLRLPDVEEIADGTQDVLVIRIHTDAGLCQLPVRRDAKPNRRTRAASGGPGAHRDEVRLGAIRPEPYARPRACGGGPPIRRKFEGCYG